MRLLFGLIIICWGAGLSACSDARPSYDTVLKNVHVIDTQTGVVTRDQALLISDGVLVAIEPASTLRPTAGLTVLEGYGGYVIPGLWDSHVHVLGDVEAALDRHLPLYVAFGITHIRDMGSNLTRLDAVRETLAAEPDRIAPSILASGPLLMQFEQRWYGDIQRAVGEPGAAEIAVQELAQAGVDFLKAYTGLSRGAYLEIMTTAEALGLPVDGHVPDSMGLTGVVEAGQRTIEHLDLSAFLSCAGGSDGPYGHYLALFFTEGAVASYELSVDFWANVDWSICGPALEALSARGGAVTPTLSMELRDRTRLSEQALALLPAGSRDWCAQGLSMIDEVPAELLAAHTEAFLSAFNQVRARGVTLLAGTDAPNHCLAHGVSLSGELARMAEAGMPLLEVLQSATLASARVFGAAGGRITVGEPADLAVLANNPLEGVNAYTGVQGVYTNGRWVSSEQIAEIRLNASDS